MVGIPPKTIILLDRNKLERKLSVYFNCCWSQIQSRSTNGTSLTLTLLDLVRSTTRMTLIILPAISTSWARPDSQRVLVVFCYYVNKKYANRLLSPSLLITASLSLLRPQVMYLYTFYKSFIWEYFYEAMMEREWEKRRSLLSTVAVYVPPSPAAHLHTNEWTMPVLLYDAECVM